MKQSCKNHANLHNNQSINIARKNSLHGKEPLSLKNKYLRKKIRIVCQKRPNEEVEITLLFLLNSLII